MTDTNQQSFQTAQGNDKDDKVKQLTKILAIKKYLKQRQGLDNVGLLANRLPLMIIKYEVSPNLCYFKRLLTTIISNSNTIFEYNTKNQQTQQYEITIEPIVNNEVYVEQFGQKQLVISGTSSQKKDKRFTLYQKNKVKEFEMMQSRFLHRTIYDPQFQNIYIISGKSRHEGSTYIKNCEVFNIERQQFKAISDICQEIQTFGIAIGQEKIWTFGGTSWSNIQSYDVYNDSWMNHEVALNTSSSAQAAYIPHKGSILVWDGGSSCLQTCYWDFKQLITLNAKYPDYTHWPYNAPQIIQQQLYVFSFDLRLFTYDFEKDSFKLVRA